MGKKILCLANVITDQRSVKFYRAITKRTCLSHHTPTFVRLDDVTAVSQSKGFCFTQPAAAHWCKNWFCWCSSMTRRRRVQHSIARDSRLELRVLCASVLTDVPSSQCSSWGWSHLCRLALPCTNSGRILRLIPGRDRARKMAVTVTAWTAV